MRNDIRSMKVTKAQEYAQAYWREYGKANPEPLPIHDFRLPPNQKTLRLSRFELMTWTDKDSGQKKYGWVTGRKFQDASLGYASPMLVAVTEIPPDLSAEEAILNTANPYPLRLCIPPQPYKKDYKDAFIVAEI